MKQAKFISELPNIPTVYALLGGRGSRKYIAYVGITDRLRRRIEQHLVNRDSSVAVGTSATGINPDHVSRVIWWENEQFKDSDVRRVAEKIAADKLDPALRSRSGQPKGVDNLLSDESFSTEMQTLFSGDPTGSLDIPTLQDAMERISDLENRLSLIEENLENLNSAY